MLSKNALHCLFPERKLESYIVALMSCLKKDTVTFYCYDVEKVPEAIKIYNVLPHHPALCDGRDVIVGGVLSSLYFLDKRVAVPSIISNDPGEFSKVVSIYSIYFEKINSVLLNVDLDEFEWPKELDTIFSELDTIATFGHLKKNSAITLVDCLFLALITLLKDFGVDFSNKLTKVPSFDSYIASLSQLECVEKVLKGIDEARNSTPFWEQPGYDIKNLI